MRIALINSNKKTNFYSVGLLKIGSYLKKNGVECQLFDNKLPENKKFDEIWITTVFTFDCYYVKAMIKKAFEICDCIKVGGISATLLPDFFKRTGAKVHTGLLEGAEKEKPDYSLLSEIPDYSVTHTSRGCVRKCGFCMVNKVEPVFFNRKWENDLHPKAKKIFFFDNNWLAKKKKYLFRDIDLVHSLVLSGKINKIDFNGGLDCRLLTDEIASKLKGLPFEYVRFAFDNMQEDGHYQRAVRLMAGYGFKSFMAYVLYNFNDTSQNLYYRLKESAFLKDELGLNVCGSFPMRFQPILDINKRRDFTGKHWKPKTTKAFMAIYEKCAIGGAITMGLKEFEYWFGKNSDEFVKLLNYPKIRMYMNRKKENLRYNGRNFNQKNELRNKCNPAFSQK